MAGSSTDTSTELSPTYTYERPGTYLARFTATDPHDASSTASVQVKVTSSSECPRNNVRGDEFEGDSLDTNRWQIIRPDNTRPPTVLRRQPQLPDRQRLDLRTGTSARVAEKGLRYRVTCEESCRVTSVLLVKGDDRQRLGRSRARRVDAGESRRMVLRLDRGVRRNLVDAMRKAKLRRLRATLVVKVVTADGTTTLRRRVTLAR